MAIVLDDLVPRSRVRPLTPLLLIGLAAFVLHDVARQNLDQPHGDRPIRRQRAQLEEVFPRFGSVSANKGIARQISELRDLVERHALAQGRAFTVLDEFPLVHYLVDSQNPALMDWYWKSERRGMEDRLRDQLLGLDAIFLIYRGAGPSPLGFLIPDSGACRAEEFDESMPLKAAVYRAFRLVESTRFFCVLDSAEGSVPVKQSAEVN